MYSFGRNSFRLRERGGGERQHLPHSVEKQGLLVKLSDRSPTLPASHDMILGGSTQDALKKDTPKGRGQLIYLKERGPACTAK